MRVPSLLLAGAALVGSVQHPLVAQLRSNWSIQGSGLYSDYGGDAFSHIDPGFGIEIQARRRLTSVWSVGCGFQGTYHSHKLPSGDVRIEGGFCEPRRAWAVANESAFPYLAVRGAFVHRSDTNNDSTSFNASANGFTANLGAGVMVPIGGQTGRYPFLFEFGGSVGYSWFDDLVFDRPNEIIVTTRPGGSSVIYMLRVGIAMGLLAGHP